MDRIRTRRSIGLAAVIAGTMALTSLPVHAVNIPEGGAITPDTSFLFHLRVTSTCDGLPMDELEVTIPEGVTKPVPEAVPGWSVVVETPESADGATGEEAAEADESAEAESEEDEEPALTLVRWSGGQLEDGQLLDFGLKARFPDEKDAVLEFPVVQRCGDLEVESAPTVTLAQRYGQAETAALAGDVDQLRADVDALRADVDQLQEQVGDVDVKNLRSRVADNEKAIDDLDERVSTLEGEPVDEPEEPEPEE